MDAAYCTPSTIHSKTNRYGRKVVLYKFISVKSSVRGVKDFLPSYLLKRYLYHIWKYVICQTGFYYSVVVHIISFDFFQGEENHNDPYKSKLKVSLACSTWC